MANTDLLDQINTRLESLESTATQAKESKDSGSVWGWILALVLGAAVSIGAALLIWQLNKKNKELAELRTKIEQDEVRSAELQHELETAHHRANIDKLAEEASVVRARIVSNADLLAVEQARHIEALARVEAAKSWDRLDELNKR